MQNNHKEMSSDQEETHNYYETQKKHILNVESESQSS